MEIDLPAGSFAVIAWYSSHDFAEKPGEVEGFVDTHFARQAERSRRLALHASGDYCFPSRLEEMAALLAAIDADPYDGGLTVRIVTPSLLSLSGVGNIRHEH